MNRRRFLGSVGGGVGLGLLSLGTAAGDSHSQNGGYEPLGVVEVPGARDAAVHHDGDVAYVATGDGFAVVDISDPADPAVLAERRTVDTDTDRELGLVWDLWPANDRLVVVGPAQEREDVPDGFALFDISDPAEPRQVAWHGTDHFIHNSFFVDETVYLTGSGLPENPLVVVDVTDDDPEELARWSIVDHDERWLEVPSSNRILHDVFVQDGVAYLPYWDAGTWLVDVSDPGDPEVRSRVGGLPQEELRELSASEAALQAGIPPGNAHYAQVDEDGAVLLVGAEAWEQPDPETNGEETVGGPGGVDLWDVTDDESPEHLAHIDPPESFDNTTAGWFTTAHNCDIVGDRIYCSWYFGGVTVHDASDPADPERLAWWRDPTEASFWTARSAAPGETFVGSSVDLGGSFDVPNQTASALYVFPDEPGVQEDPPDLTTPPAETPTPAESRPPDSAETPRGEVADGHGPGFGLAGAVAGLGVLALARRRDRSTTE